MPYERSLFVSGVAGDWARKHYRPVGQLLESGVFDKLIAVGGGQKRNEGLVPLAHEYISAREEPHKLQRRVENHAEKDPTVLIFSPPACHVDDIVLFANAWIQAGKERGIRHQIVVSKPLTDNMDATRQLDQELACDQRRDAVGEYDHYLWKGPEWAIEWLTPHLIQQYGPPCSFD